MSDMQILHKEAQRLGIAIMKTEILRLLNTEYDKSTPEEKEYIYKLFQKIMDIEAQPI